MLTENNVRMNHNILVKASGWLSAYHVDCGFASWPGHTNHSNGTNCLPVCHPSIRVGVWHATRLSKRSGSVWDCI